MGVPDVEEILLDLHVPIVGAGFLKVDQGPRFRVASDTSYSLDTWTIVPFARERPLL